MSGSQQNIQKEKLFGGINKKAKPRQEKVIKVNEEEEMKDSEVNMIQEKVKSVVESVAE